MLSAKQFCATWQFSTIADTWVHLTNISQAGERNRVLSIVKSCSMKHSNQVRELILSDQGVTLADVYTAVARSHSEDHRRPGRGSKSVACLGAAATDHVRR